MSFDSTHQLAVHRDKCSALRTPFRRALTWTSSAILGPFVSACGVDTQYEMHEDHIDQFERTANTIKCLRPAICGMSCATESCQRCGSHVQLIADPGIAKADAREIAPCISMRCIPARCRRYVRAEHRRGGRGPTKVRGDPVPRLPGRGNTRHPGICRRRRRR
jgi:hypothetical protein